MYPVEISGWEKGFNKVAHTKALQEFCKLGLGDAKARTDAVLDGAIVLVGVETQDRAEELVARLIKMGAIARVKRES